MHTKIRHKNKEYHYVGELNQCKIYANNGDYVALYNGEIIYAFRADESIRRYIMRQLQREKKLDSENCT